MACEQWFFAYREMVYDQTGRLEGGYSSINDELGIYREPGVAFEFELFDSHNNS